ncbi:MAG: hypothetical protein QOJ53_2239 [Sphingomonadales bacterium]|jgi:hypothetical protein|nr:hypothetical protein [Sphingomonadales bacterium]MEA3042409.1 hypothetical protein [Sphingomonadales bacterium]MEA3047907.1 hypothetical protein [Sphingomonadales bacterium]
MSSATFGTIASGSGDIDAGVLVEARMRNLPRPAVRSGKRLEDTAAGCRANAAADLGRAQAPGGDFMRARLEHSAAVWAERADLLERLEKKFQARMHAA